MSQGAAAVNPVEVDALLEYWRAANYLTVAQIYLQANPLLREPLTADHIKPRLLGHWGTSPALNLIYAQLNRLIRQRDCDVLYVTGPGTAAPPSSPTSTGTGCSPPTRRSRWCPPP
jgi:xylulose-5-phosphate/fructose-6-phosphate phosphoketolase